MGAEANPGKVLRKIMFLFPSIALPQPFPSGAVLTMLCTHSCSEKGWSPLAGGDTSSCMTWDTRLCWRQVCTQTSSSCAAPLPAQPPTPSAPCCCPEFGRKLSYSSPEPEICTLPPLCPPAAPCPLQCPHTLTSSCPWVFCASISAPLCNLKLSKPSLIRFHKGSSQKRQVQEGICSREISSRHKSLFNK